MDNRSIVEERIRRMMVGRAAETELFKQQFDNVLEGGTGLIVISGRPGIGKTFFAEQAAGLFSGGGATYVHGKFRQYEDRPLSAFSEIIEQTVRHILTLPTESLEHIKNDLNRRLGADTAVLLSVCPYAAAAVPNLADGDFLLHLGKMEKISEDEGYLYLLELVTRRDRADYCAVFFERSGEMHLQYEMRKDGEAQTHREPVNMNHLSGLPHKVLRYVARTETEVLLGRNSGYGIFSNDSYLTEKGKLSLLCLPIKYSGVLAGIIYLEKANEEGFGGSLPSMVKGFLPTLLSKRTNLAILGEMNARGSEKTKNGNGLKLQNRNDILTDREIDVLKLIAEGMSNAEISQKLHITLGTVRNHLSSIYSKLEADNRVKAVMKAKELNIIQL